ncbi:hypothetical protein AGABI1DRAFT_45586, partial [Agaricus bisporus var. burnettii JB137-S8]
ADKYFQIAAVTMLTYDHRKFALLESCFRCDNYVLFEGCSYVALVAIPPCFKEILVSVIMILRVVAIYGRSKKILAFLLLIWTGQIIISVVGLRTGFGCILTGNDTLFRKLTYSIYVPDIKQVGASFSQLLTCTMISRLVLNLRSLSNAHSGHTTRITALEFNNQHDPLDQSGTAASTQAETIWSRTLNDFTETEAQVERTHDVIS